MSVICFGEILWDFLPGGLFPGGAPFNVGYHLHRHGMSTEIISAVGRDVLGDELLRRVKLWGMSTAGIARHDRLPTGFVRATLGAGGDACYEIITDVAWDEIPATTEMVAAAAQAEAFIYGSLAQRSSVTRTALSRLLQALPPSAMRVFDVNLRPPHDDLALVRELARAATLLKLNHDEAARLTGRAAVNGGEEAAARALAAETGCGLVVVTAGAQGAGLLRHANWHWELGRAVSVRDTVGAGDAFLASLVTHLLGGKLSDADCLARACRLGEWVASQAGATPPYDALAVQ